MHFEFSITQRLVLEWKMRFSIVPYTPPTLKLDKKSTESDDFFGLSRLGPKIFLHCFIANSQWKRSPASRSGMWVACHPIIIIFVWGSESVHMKVWRIGSFGKFLGISSYQGSKTLKSWKLSWQVNFYFASKLQIKITLLPSSHRHCTHWGFSLFDLGKLYHQT